LPQSTGAAEEDWRGGAVNALAMEETDVELAAELADVADVSDSEAELGAAEALAEVFATEERACAFEEGAAEDCWGVLEATLFAEEVCPHTFGYD
jgi:hypothetical protein